MNVDKDGPVVRLNKLNYYGDFLLYPLVIGGMSWLGLVHGTNLSARLWVLAAGGGVALWTLLEYGLHRVLFHRIGPVVALHALHHSRPRELIGAPTWLTAVLLLVTVFMPLSAMFSLGLASAVLAGVVTGYLAYVTVHHLVHHRQPRLVRRAIRSLRMRHMAHHHPGLCGNFGVTTAGWDILFGTRLKEPGLSRTTRRPLRQPRVSSAIRAP